MVSTERDEFMDLISVSHETGAKFDRYAVLLAEWNQKFNLVAESTIPHIWKRHFLDSAQLFKHIPEGAQNIADMGSGAGFPGLVLSIMGAPKIHLIESTGKKANFLRAVIEDLKLDAEVHQERAESIKNLKADVITARAMASLLDLLNLSNNLRNKHSFCLFPKGQNADAELTESAKYWRFDHEKIQSISDPSGSVLILKDIKNAAPRKIKFRKD
ncbi:MAG: 16S rRNA (guanine(527)-N(7))-methyltransferase RsmG [Alphaproteobacteria bacterium]